MIVYPEDGKVINMLDAMEIIKKFKNSKQDKYTAKMQEWIKVYHSLGPGWTCSGGYIAIKETFEEFVNR